MTEDPIDLAMKAAEYLYSSDRDFVESGCSDVSQVIGEYLKRKGVPVKIVYGIARLGKKGASFPHAWLEIGRKHFDPTLLAQGKDPSKYYYEIQPGTVFLLTDDAITKDVIESYVPELEAVLG